MKEKKACEISKQTEKNQKIHTRVVFTNCTITIVCELWKSTSGKLLLVHKLMTSIGHCVGHWTKVWTLQSKLRKIEFIESYLKTLEVFLFIKMFHIVIEFIFIRKLCFICVIFKDSSGFLIMFQIL